jgi:hypothetical protein
MVEGNGSSGETQHRREDTWLKLRHATTSVCSASIRVPFPGFSPEVVRPERPQETTNMTLFLDAQSPDSVVITQQSHSDAFSERATPSPVMLQETKEQGGRLCAISPQDALSIFLAAKHNRTKYDRLANRLAEEYGITSKAVRDIWSLRTWARITRPHWAKLDKHHFKQNFAKRQSILINQTRRLPKPPLRTTSSACTSSRAPTPPNQIAASIAQTHGAMNESIKEPTENERNSADAG